MRAASVCMWFIVFMYSMSLLGRNLQGCQNLGALVLSWHCAGKWLFTVSCVLPVMTLCRQVFFFYGFCDIVQASGFLQLSLCRQWFFTAVTMQAVVFYSCHDIMQASGFLLLSLCRQVVFYSCVCVTCHDTMQASDFLQLSLCRQVLFTVVMT